ncbi:MAG: GGDEF domain-containing phosphodiesterase [marine benthic group bacterium]|nr:GGDEF domain-containing phosphodiesterase [Gemmatimonadota bacterium]
MTIDRRIDLTALIGSIARLAEKSGSLRDAVETALESLCATTPVAFGRARLHDAAEEDGAYVWRSDLPDRRLAALHSALSENPHLAFGSAGADGISCRRLAGATVTAVEGAARMSGLSCAVYLDVAAEGRPAITLQLFTDRTIEEGEPFLLALRLVGDQLESIAATDRFRAAVAGAARHSRRLVAEREALQAQLEIRDARIERLETEIAEIEAAAHLKTYRSRDSNELPGVRPYDAQSAVPGGPAADDQEQSFELVPSSARSKQVPGVAKPQETESESEPLYDARTDLPRRAILEDRIDQAIRRRQRSPKNLFAVLAISADGLEKVAIEAGEEGLDIVTSALSRRLLAQVRSADTVAHFDPATFVVVLEEIRVLDEALRIADRIVKELQRPIWSGSSETVLGVRVGVVFGGPAYDRARPVLRDAVSALTRSRVSRTPVAVFDEAAQHEEEIRRRVEVEVGEALSSEQLYLEFQPIVSLQDGRIDGIEAFLRWRHPEHGLIPPDQFIPIAAQSPLIHDLGVWLLERSCEQVKAWQKALARSVPTIDLNVTARQILHERTAGRIKDIVTRHGLRCEQFRFDISESDLMANPAASVKALDEIRKLGCRIAIDDFGTGFSSLRLLHAMPIDAVKIDRSFVSGSRGSGTDQLAVARTIVQLARTLEAEVIAEGVETQDQFRFLRSIGCGSAQGYLFSAPVSGPKIVEMIRDGYPLETSSQR